MDIFHECVQQQIEVVGSSGHQGPDFPRPTTLGAILHKIPLGVGLVRVLSNHNTFELVYANEYFRRVLGLTEQSALQGATCWPKLPDLPMEQHLRHVWETGQAWHYSGPMLELSPGESPESGQLQEGMTLDVRLTYELWLDEQERPAGLLATLRPLAMAQSQHTLPLSDKIVDPDLGPEEQGGGSTQDSAQRADSSPSKACLEQHKPAGCSYQRKLDLCMAMLGHDLRNPLSAIQLSAHILKRHRNQGSSMALQRIIDSSTRMQRMVEQLLDFVRVRWHSGVPLSCSLVNLHHLVQDILAEWRLSQPDNAIEFSKQGDVQAWVDQDRISQMLSNMLGNALQHSELGSPIALWLNGEAQGEVVFGVRNEGYIETERLQTIFQPFAHDKQGQTSGGSGLGLGLYISEQVVLAHGGRIEVNSCPHLGTTFQVFLPRYPVAAMQ